VGAILAAVGILLLVAWLFGGPWSGTFSGTYPRPGFFFPFGLLFLLFIVFFVVRVVFWSARWGGGSGQRGRGGPRAILRARYARGEITREQFQQMMRDLNDSR
jgi:putative membrane protein